MQMTEGGRRHLEFWPGFLKECRPRLIVARERAKRPLVIFTDGAEEEEGEEESTVTVGGLIVDPEAATTEDLAAARKKNDPRPPGEIEGRFVFGGRVPKGVVQRWKSTGGKTRCIHQAELLPAAIAAEEWAPSHPSRKVILFVDNEAARASLIKGISSSEPSSEIIGHFWETVATHDWHVWLERVPSKSNAADAPSRNDWAWTSSKGFVLSSPECLDVYHMGEKSARQ